MNPSSNGALLSIAGVIGSMADLDAFKTTMKQNLDDLQDRGIVLKDQRGRIEFCLKSLHMTLYPDFYK